MIFYNKEIKMFGSTRNNSEEKTVTPINQVANLIKEKYQIEDVEVRSNISKPDEFSIALDDNAYLRGGERENARAVALLKAVGATVSTETHEVFSYLSHSVCTLNSAQCTQAVMQLQKLKTPDPTKEKLSIIKAC